jgi:ribosomal protein L32
MRRLIRCLALVLGACALPGLMASAQTPIPSLRLSLSKSFGFNLGGMIQGHFQLTAQGPADLASVTFMIDGRPLSEVRAAPFVLSFNTDDYAPGIHNLAATGLSVTGQELESPVIHMEFITSQQAWSSTQKLVIPLLVALALIVGGGMLLPLILSSRRSQFSLGNYGAAGAAVCPRCHLPFSRHIMSLHLLAGKLERCPHCGKWSLRRRATPDEITRAEARYLDQSRPADSPAAIDDYRRELDESRFDS